MTTSRSRSGSYLTLDNSVGNNTTRSTKTVSGVSERSANSISPTAVQPPRSLLVQGNHQTNMVSGSMISLQL